MEEESQPLLLQRPATHFSHRWPLYSSVGCMLLFRFQVGMIVGFPIATLETLQVQGLLQGTLMTSLYAAFVMLGKVLGAIPLWLLLERYGRRFIILLALLTVVLGWCSTLLAAGLQVSVPLLLAQVINGAASGIGDVACSMYISEVTTKDNRGWLNMLQQLTVPLGKTLVAALAIVIPWQQVTLLSFCLAVLNLALSFVGMEKSPRWLVKVGQHSEAREVLQRIRPQDADIATELEGIAEVIQEPVSVQEFLKSPKLYKPAWIVSLLTFTIFAAGFPILVYISTFLDDAGMQSDTSLAVFGISTASILGGIIVIWFINKVSRRTVFLSVLGTSVLAFIVIGIPSYVYQHDHGHPLVWLAVVGQCLLNISFFGVWGLCQLLSVELLPLSIRGMVFSTLMLVLNLLTFGGGVAALQLFSAWGVYTVVWLFAALLLVCMALICRFLPETKGKTLEEVEALFSSTTNS